MLKRRCLERQKAALDFSQPGQLYYGACKDCDQGQQIKREIEESMPIPNPVEGEGLKALKCALYNGCLTLAAKKQWQKFNCEECEYNEDDPMTEIDLDESGGEQSELDALADLDFDGVSLSDDAPGEDHEESPESTETSEDIRLCEICGEKPTITPKHKHCPHCMAEMSKQKAAENRPDGPEQKTGTKAKARPRKAPQGQDQALTIDFDRYVSILDEVKKLADEEMRPVEMQVIYMLRQYLDNQEKEVGS